MTAWISTGSIRMPRILIWSSSRPRISITPSYRYRPRSPEDGLRAGVRVVYQELSLLTYMTVEENLSFETLPSHAGRAKSSAASGAMQRERIRYAARGQLFPLSSRERNLSSGSRRYCSDLQRFPDLQPPHPRRQ